MNCINWIILAICFSAGGTLFFSVNLMSLRVFSQAKLQEIFKKNGKENLTNRIIENEERLILSCSLYRIICNVAILLLLLIVFTIISKDHLSTIDYILTIIIATIILLVFSLAIPHSWSKYSSEKILSQTYSLLIFFAALTIPLLYAMQLYDNIVRRLAGVAETTPQELQEEKQEEFLTNLQQHKLEGAVDAEEQEMIENVLELTDSTADEIITPRTDVVAVRADSDLHTILNTINSAGHSRVPVYEKNIDNIIGFIYAKDLLTEIGKDPKDFDLKSKMREAYFVPETKPLRKLLHEFQNRKLHIAVVLDEYGGTAGIVTLEDILEELVGEITDEYEQAPQQQVKKIDQNTIEVDARTYIDDVNDKFNLNLPEEEDYDTIGGFVFSHLGCIPKTGKSFIYNNLRFTISSAEPRKIKHVRIQKICGSKDVE